MRRWTAVVPLKPRGQRKTRLAGTLSEDERDALSERLLSHVAAVLGQCPAIEKIYVLAALPPQDGINSWLRDEGRGLNRELEHARTQVGTPLLVIHPDLPLLSVGDVTALCLSAEAGVALAPDRHGAGTNAVALATGNGFRFAFGPESLQHHVSSAEGRPIFVERDGLALDLDTADDLAAALASGFEL